MKKPSKAVEQFDKALMRDVHERLQCKPHGLSLLSYVLAVISIGRLTTDRSDLAAVIRMSNLAKKALDDYSQTQLHKN